MTSATVILRCRAPHPDPRRRGEECGTPLCHALPATYTWVGIAERMPNEPDGLVYKPCPRKACRAINVFAIAGACGIHW